MIHAHAVQVKNINIAMASLTKPVLQVAVGVILRQQQVLLAKRAANKHQGDRWEFPGGKLEANESALAALQRELAEEIAIDVLSAESLLELSYDYPERIVQLHIFLVTAFHGEPEGLEGQPLYWAPLAELTQLAIPDANLPIVELLQQRFG